LANSGPQGFYFPTALRASEEQIQEAVKLKPGQQMFIDLYLGGV
jgi:hypothetical protein